MKRYHAENAGAVNCSPIDAEQIRTKRRRRIGVLDVISRCAMRNVYRDTTEAGREKNV
jgi:hypothetical protein